MWVLLKEGARTATLNSILVAPRVGRCTLETLRGKPVAKGIVARIDERAVTTAVERAASVRREESVSSEEMLRDLRKLHSALGDYKVGSKIGLQPSRGALTLDVSEATAIDRAADLAIGDTIAIGPAISPLAWMSARGRVLWFEAAGVIVELDPGDRNRLERALGREVSQQPTIPFESVEKV